MRRAFALASWFCLWARARARSQRLRLAFSLVAGVIFALSLGHDTAKRGAAITGETIIDDLGAGFFHGGSALGSVYSSNG